MGRVQSAGGQPGQSAPPTVAHHSDRQVIGKGPNAGFDLQQGMLEIAHLLGEISPSFDIGRLIIELDAVAARSLDTVEEGRAKHAETRPGKAFADLANMGIETENLLNHHQSPRGLLGTGVVSSKTVPVAGNQSDYVHQRCSAEPSPR